MIDLNMLFSICSHVLVPQTRLAHNAVVVKDLEEYIVLL